MSIADELQKLEELHRSGALSDEEFAQAKAAVLAIAPTTMTDGAADVNPSPVYRELTQQLDEIARRQQVDQIDREWQNERETYMVGGTQGGTWVDGRYVGGAPYRYVPTRAGSIVMGIVVAVGGVVWIAFTAPLLAGGFALFGIIFIAFGIGWAAYAYSRASQYEQAQSAYLSRREEVLFGSGRDEAAGPPSEHDWRTDPPPTPEERQS
jgi:hypothetical protein